MREGYDENPLNPVPAAIWLLALPIILGEAAFGLGRLGFVGGGRGAGDVLRQVWVERTAFAPEFIARMLDRGAADGQLYRLLSYPFVHYSLTHAIFVVVFLLALGNAVSRVFRPAGVVAVFVGGAVAGALIYTLVGRLAPGLALGPLVGGYPAVYGLLGAFTFLLWARLGAENANQLRAFTLIGVLLGFQLIFGLLFGNAGYSWIAEVAGFCAGFALSFVLVPGGLGRVRRQIRHR